ncbi:MAG: hypothetical protein EOO37_03180 [Cytophagaceae bacterium]|nr:MAG: hypothetical protein EOO37_03180 [Cytophagaceae bacterium]
MANNVVPRLIPLLPGMIIALFFTVVGFHEWFTVGWLATPAIVKQYPFGNEEAMFAGGWHYQNAHLYARTELVEGLAYLAVLGVFATAIIRRTKQLPITAYMLLLLVWGIMYFITHQLPTQL